MTTSAPGLLCLACYKDRLASVYENADAYKLFEIRDDDIYPAGLLSLPSKDPMDRTSAILACGVSFLMCGALCEREQVCLEQNGVTVTAWISGTVEDVLEAFARQQYRHLVMPGCQKHFDSAKRAWGGDAEAARSQPCSMSSKFPPDG